MCKAIGQSDQCTKLLEPYVAVMKLEEVLLTLFIHFYCELS